MKVAINRCFGGFSLSPLAVQEIAKRKGKECYFFKINYETDEYESLTVKEAKEELMFFAYTVSNPQDYELNVRDKDGLYGSANKRAEEISLDNRPKERHDLDLVSVIEMLGEKANGRYADLKIVEIPDGTNYEIEEYDGMEHIAEKHKSWA